MALDWIGDGGGGGVVDGDGGVLCHWEQGVCENALAKIGVGIVW